MSSIAPFVVVSIGVQHFETRVVEKIKPVWNQEHNLYVYLAILVLSILISLRLIHKKTMDEKIHIDIMNMSTFARYQKLGSLSVSTFNFYIQNRT